MNSNFRSHTLFVFFSRFYWLIAIGIFIAVEMLVVPDKFSVFSILLKVPYLAENPRLSAIFSEFVMGTVASFFCFIAVRLLGQKITFRHFWATVLLLLGTISFFRPMLVNANASMLTEVFKMLSLIIALVVVYRLGLGVAFSVSTFGYLVLLAPAFFGEVTSVSARKEVSAQAVEISELRKIGLSLRKFKAYITDSHKLQEIMNRLHLDAQQGHSQAQYDLATIYLMRTPLNAEPPEQYDDRAFQWLTKATQQGLPEAQTLMGHLYLEARGIPFNPSQAAVFYRQAADKGNLDAEAMLGWLYAHGWGVNVDTQEALRRYTLAAHGDSALGLWGLADMSLTGNGTQRDHALGLSLCAEAAKKECVPAMTRLGQLLLATAETPAHSQQAVDPLHEAALEASAEAEYAYIMVRGEGLHGAYLPLTAAWWGDQLTLAARAGNADAQWYASLLLENGLLGAYDAKKAWTWLSQSSYKGFPPALDREGDYLTYGLAGERDPAKAQQAYQAAAQYNPKAMYTLIFRHRDGRAAAVKDPKKVDYYLTLLRKTADRGDVQAEYYVGELFRNGLVMPRNFPQALVWYRRSAENGYGPAFYRLAEMYENGEGVPKDEASAFRLYRRAAAVFHLPAFYPLAVRYSLGQGVAKNAVEAKEWFLRIQRGAQRGSLDHRVNLARLAERGLFVPRNESAAAAAYQAAGRDDVDVQRMIGNMYMNGRGVPKDVQQAYGWLDYAARRGDSRAQQMADALLKTLSPANREKALAFSLTFQP